MDCEHRQIPDSALGQRQKTGEQDPGARCAATSSGLGNLLRPSSAAAGNPIWRTVELTAILVGRGSDGSQERTPHDISSSKPAGGSNLFKAAIRLFEPVTSCLDARLQNILRWCPSYLARERALKIPDAHGDAICKNLHRQFLWQILHDPNLKLLDGLHLGCLRGQRNAQLLLAAGPAKEKDELTRYFLGTGGSAILLDPGKRQIDPCGDPRRSVDVCIFDPHQFGFNLHLGISAG